MNKNITTKTFSTFITTLKEELKAGYSLVKFQHKVGFFCGVLSNDTEVSKEYKDALNAIDPKAKDFVLQKVMSLLDKPEVKSYSPIREDKTESIDDKIEQWHNGAGDGKELYEFLGMTSEEYSEFIKPKNTNVATKPKRTRKVKASKVEE